jgi:hypothetical protein
MDRLPDRPSLDQPGRFRRSPACPQGVRAYASVESAAATSQRDSDTALNHGSSCASVPLKPNSCAPVILSTDPIEAARTYQRLMSSDQ